MFSIPLPHVALVLAERWGLSEARIQAFPGGMTSEVWAVDHGEGRWVAKAVPAKDADEFATGLEIAARLEQAGFAAGAPRPTLDGQITVLVGDWVLALLRRVEGTELTGKTEDDLRLIGRTLGRAHRALGTVPASEGTWVGWNPGAQDLAVQPWVRPAVEVGIARIERLGLTSIARGLLAALDYRQAVQAAYFARRIARNDLTGIDGPARNYEGLEHARAYWFERAAALGLTLPDA
jgi:Phosphotransferase enzyme family